MSGKQPLSPPAGERRFVSFDGTPIFYRKRPSGIPALAVVILVHGMAEHGGRYTRFAEYLSGMGCSVWLPDTRGFGRSGGARASLRHFSDLHRDLEAVHRLALSEDGDLPCILIGHSFGGLICASYLALHEDRAPCAGLVLSSPSFGIAVPVAAWRKALGWVASFVAPDLTQPTGLTAESLTHDAEILREYAQDDLILHRISARLYREMVVMAAKRSLIASKLRLPVLVLQAGDDKIVCARSTGRFYEEIASTRKEWVTYPGWYHEILNETGRAEVFTRIGAWISSTSSASHSN